MNYPKNFRQMFYESANKYTCKDAFLYNYEEKIKKITYLKFHNDIVNRANTIHSICKGENIAIIGRNSYEFILVMAACLCGAGRLFLVDGDNSEDWLLDFFKESKVDMLLYDNTYEGKAKMIESRINLKSSHNIDKFYNYVSKEQEKFCFDDFLFHEMRIVFTTSGTSQGNKKRVMLSGQALLNNLIAFEEEAFSGGSSGSKIQLLVLPLFHIYAFICAALHGVYVGNTTYISSNPNNIENDMIKCNPHYICVVPAILNFLYNRYQNKLANGTVNCISKYFGNNFMYFLCGGAKNNPQIIQGYYNLGIEVLRGYGMSETAPVISVTNLRTAAIDFVNAGSPICHEIKIINGEICICGENLMLGYHLEPELTVESYSNGWFCTGDAGYIGENGLLYITGRIKNVIVLSSGKKVIPEEIEELVSKIKGVLECAVFSVNDAFIHIYIYCEDIIMYSDSILEKVESLNSKQPLYKKLQQIIIGDVQLPKTSTNKIYRNKVEQHANLMNINNELRKMLMDILYYKTFIGSNDKFSEKLSFDSFEMTSFIFEIEDKYGCKVDIDKYLKINTLLELSTYVLKLVVNN